MWLYFFLFKQKTAYAMRISDWSSDVCSSDLGFGVERAGLLERECRFLRRGEAVAAPEHEQVRRPGEGGDRGRPVERIGGGQPFGQLVERARQPRIFGPGGDQCGDGQIGRASCRERVCQYV